MGEGGKTREEKKVDEKFLSVNFFLGFFLFIVLGRSWGVGFVCMYDDEEEEEEEEEEGKKELTRFSENSRSKVN